MANEIQVPYTSGATLYANVTNPTGSIWNGSAFVTYNGANYATYAVALSDAARGGFYLGSFPAAAAGVYNVAVYIQAGGSPAVTDVPLTAGEMQWDGSAEVPLSSLAPAATALSTAQWTNGRAGNLDNLDATVSSRLPTSSYTVPLDAAGTRGAVGLAFANLDAQLASKQATFTAATGVSFPANFSSLTISGGGAVTAGTVTDKTGYSLTQGFPANFADLAVTAATGQVTVGTNADKTGYSISGTKTTLDALNDVSTAQVKAQADAALSDVGVTTTVTGRIDVAASTRQATFTAGTGITFPTNFGATVISAAGLVSADVKKLNGATLNGSGTALDPWGP